MNRTTIQLWNKFIYVLSSFDTIISCGERSLRYSLRNLTGETLLLWPLVAGAEVGPAPGGAEVSRVPVEAVRVCDGEVRRFDFWGWRAEDNSTPATLRTRLPAAHVDRLFLTFPEGTPPALSGIPGRDSQKHV